ncbi:DUF4276 family protein [Thiocystis violascens]|uniref:DUF4276 family protein n=1 Tax=Thiocystis violascens (strain ATCC 17096 / DSM 198 / 6111) TaxID=765911 RepID=I3YGN1_THIV6|nr:DUF4276 family protein [Thiocystis violascens]AFL76149.1 hypothetical protein Thivi_4339 [Thiocystis violascens DSM 198]
MVEVIVFAEGPTEEQFIKRLVAPALRHLEVFVKPRMLKTSAEARGGAVSFERLMFNARNTLRQNPDVILTTLLDLYGLETSFPAFAEARMKQDVFDRLACLESAMADAIVAHVGCRPERFIPYIQPHEFEGLLFSDVQALVRTEPSWIAHESCLAAIRTAFESPEHINDSYETKPSRRLEALLRPGYKKTRHGPLAAERIGLPRMEQECPHFRGWMDRLRSLGV